MGLSLGDITDPFEDAWDGISDAVGDVFGGVMKGFDKLTGGAFSDLMNNDWVRYALTAVSVVYGGIAIANGIMAMGQAGIGEAAKQFATNMSMETGKNLVGTMIEGGKQFISGVAKGMTDPGGSQAGKALGDTFNSVVGSITGDASTATEHLASGSTAASKAAADAGVAVPTSQSAVYGQTTSGIRESVPAWDANLTDLAQGGDAALKASQPAFGGTDFADGVANYMRTGSYDAPALGANIGEAAATGLKGADLSSPGMLQQIGTGVKDVLMSPQGMMTAGQMMQGWANGQMLQERWDQMQEDEKRRYRSWVGGGKKNLPGYQSVRFGPNAGMGNVQRIQYNQG